MPHLVSELRSVFSMASITEGSAMKPAPGFTSTPISMKLDDENFFAVERSSRVNNRRQRSTTSHYRRRKSSESLNLVNRILSTQLGRGRKNEERKLAEQETKFGNKTEQELHAYAWKSTHMRATSSPTHA
ncbi:hypothetical protein PIB30_070879 [Stylosanthes scabra]|uniref:Uncharacterized protein n=1 Tax=Stylosanthes scabra TaxID=79078 RepID=A0ABU6SQL2_9FABA|nr:hypothetical protein [Stylosanthes scabra]